MLQAALLCFISELLAQYRGLLSHVLMQACLLSVSVVVLSLLSYLFEVEMRVSCPQALSSTDVHCSRDVPSTKVAFMYPKELLILLNHLTKHHMNCNKPVTCCTVGAAQIVFAAALLGLPRR
jgi:hypothetical protein